MTAPIPRAQVPAYLAELASLRARDRDRILGDVQGRAKPGTEIWYKDSESTLAAQVATIETHGDDYFLTFILFGKLHDSGRIRAADLAYWRSELETYRGFTCWTTGMAPRPPR